MSDVAPHNETTEKPPKLPALVAGLIVVGGVAWYFWVKNDWDNAGTWGAIGDAVGPFTGLATALALGFAVYATMLQREELKLQRDEMRAQREEMKLQREEAAKAASAQEKLARSQERLAIAQEESNQLQQGSITQQKRANYLTRYQELAQRRANMATLQTLIAHAKTAAAATNNSQLERVVLERLKDVLARAEERLEEEHRRVLDLEAEYLPGGKEPAMRRKRAKGQE